MPHPEKRKTPGPHAQGFSEVVINGHNLDISVPLPNRVEQACDAFGVLLLNPEGKVVRRFYLSLHSAEKAYKRAQAAGKPVRLVLCRMLPVMPGDLDGRWRE